jgi:serine/threonine-protein kinase
MYLDRGTKLGPYEILEAIGAGGMGEVFKARDTRLDRIVAIKISAAQFTERFEREARAVAALNHPHVCTLHDVGPDYLVMEFVEGPTLAERIAAGPIPMEEVLAIARQIAEALEAAHEKGIVHRDLKPGNLKFTAGGQVKVLDFGLAKALEPETGVDPRSSPTLTLTATRAGVILGTAAYMSPEQARGIAADKRTDIWSFGVVLYEMLTGRHLFHSETVSDTLAGVLKTDPDWKTLPCETPASIRRLLQHCLERDRKRRLRDIGDALVELDAPEQLVTSPPAHSRKWPWVAALGVAVCLSAAGWLRSPPPVMHPMVRLSADLPPGKRLPSRGGGEVAHSPDGLRFAIIEEDEAGTARVATRRLDEDQFAPLSGTEGAKTPFFSPDGWIGFFAGGKLKKVAVQGGSPATLCDAPGNTRGASWGDDGNIIAALNLGTAGLSRISSGGGPPTPVTGLSMEKGESLSYPQVLPGSKAVLFTALAGGLSNPDDAEIGVISLSTGQRKIVQRRGFFPRYLASGHLAYMRQGTLYAAPFDPNRLAVTGAAQPVLEDIRLVGLAASASFDCSQTGTCIYLSGKFDRSQAIFWIDSSGKISPLVSDPDYYMTPRFSPDGRRLAFAMGTGQARDHDLWVKDLENNTTTRLTHMPGSNTHPLWTTDGAHIVFESLLGAYIGPYWIRTDGAGEPQRLTDDNIRRTPYSFSPDGKRLAYSQLTGGQSEIWTAPVESNPDRARLGKPELFLRVPSSAFSAKFSPDGHWMAYQSDETGRYEVYVSPSPGSGRKQPVSTGGGWFPIWSHNGRELFFLSPDWRIMVASYTASGDTFVPGKPRLWSDRRLLRGPAQNCDLAPDDKHFAVVLAADGTAETFAQLTVLLNFFDELRRRLPPGGK